MLDFFLAEMEKVCYNANILSEKGGENMLAFLEVNDRLTMCAMDVDSSFGPYVG